MFENKYSILKFLPQNLMFFSTKKDVVRQEQLIQRKDMNVFQHTIKQPVTVNGVGLHTGMQANMTLNPAPINYGIKFKRIDMPEQPIIKADVDYVVEVTRGTTIQHQGVKICTVEHVLAALVGLQIDNVLIELDSSEVPIMDGSSKPFVEALLQAGIEKQNAEKEYFTLLENIHFYDPIKDVEMLAIPSNSYEVTVMIDFNSPVLGKQHATLNHLSDFKDEISPARTFCFLHELEILLQHNLIKGGDLSNAIVIVNKPVEQDELDNLAKLFNKPSVQVRTEGYLNNLELRHPNEPARHKLLDVIGDLALIGTPIKARIFATKPGHATNIEFGKLIKEHIKKNRHLIGAPFYDPSKEPVFDINKIINSLPHRYPFLLVDKIIELEANRVVAVKNVTYNEPFFQGHFPGHPIMPGVLIIEAMAQAGGVLLLSTVPDPENYVTYFLRIDNARFRNPVQPGSILLFKLNLLSPIRRGICEMQAVAYCGNKIAAEATLIAQIMKKNSGK